MNDVFNLRVTHRPDKFGMYELTANYRGKQFHKDYENEPTLTEIVDYMVAIEAVFNENKTSGILK